MNNLQSHLAHLYGTDKVKEILDRVQVILSNYRDRISPCQIGLTERDSILITYGDQVHALGEKPLRTFSAFCKKYLTGLVDGIHILPFYPSTSDDGFSVADYRAVDSQLGDWEDISSLQDSFRLMFDGVINHVSAHSEWFQKYLHNNLRYRDYFIDVQGSPDLSQVARPRALPLLTTFQTSNGDRRVWTTFSADQIDLNYKNPEVLLDILDILLLYIERGASFLRLDAIAYLWKEIGTTCIHLPQTHHIIQFLRAALSEVAPHVYLVTETNVPHEDNISYFGDGTNEAQLVYNFALPPLILHAFHSGDARILSDWVKNLILPSNQTTFFNFLASHDGVGLNPARGILSDGDINSLVQKTTEHGSLISYKHNPDGSQSPYEMNINYFDALSNPNGDEPLEIQVNRFIAAQAIMLVLVGVPGIYFHSLFGSRGWPEGVQQTGHNRTINREKCDLETLQKELADPSSFRSMVFNRYRQMLITRGSTPAFHPHGKQNVLDVHPSVFALERISPDGTSHALCFHNVSQQTVSFATSYRTARNLFTGESISAANITLEPYQILWVQP